MDAAKIGIELARPSRRDIDSGLDISRPHTIPVSVDERAELVVGAADDKTKCNGARLINRPQPATSDPSCEVARGRTRAHLVEGVSADWDREAQEHNAQGHGK